MKLGGRGIRRALGVWDRKSGYQLLKEQARMCDFVRGGKGRDVGREVEGASVGVGESAAGMLVVRGFLSISRKV